MIKPDTALIDEQFIIDRVLGEKSPALVWRGVLQIRSDYGEHASAGVCPPSGNKQNRYIFYGVCPQDRQVRYTR